MQSQISKTKIDRLGDRLRKGDSSEDDLRLLDEYRRSFTEAYNTVVGAIRQRLNLEPTGRPAKSTTSISEKLRRESIRLTQIQDIAGCRLIVQEISDQESLLASLIEIFPQTMIADRRQKPSHGYRAVHVIATADGKSVEIQIRTALQQAWAELSEKLSDLIDPEIKYGGGDASIKEFLSRTSTVVARYEQVELNAIESRRLIKEIMLDRSSVAVRGKLQDIVNRQSDVDAELLLVKREALSLLRDAADKWISRKRRS